MQFEKVAIDSLVLDPDNAMDHDETNLEAIKGSLKKFGQQKPIVVTGNVVKAGNGTVQAAKALGWKEIWVHRSELKDTDATAYALADNRTAQLASWNKTVLGSTLKALKEIDFDLEAIGFDEDFVGKIVPAEVTEGLTDPDEVPEDVETRCKPGDLWILGKHRLLCGDSTNVQDVERLMAGERAELCFTSPPYADQREYNGGKELSTEYLATFLRAAHGSCSLFAVNLGLSRKGGEVNPYWDDYIKEAKACGLRLLSWNVWDKGKCGSIGNQSAMFGIRHEWIFIFGPERKELNLTNPNRSAGRFDPHNTNRQADGTTKRRDLSDPIREYRQLDTVLTLVPENGRTINHPAMFPVALPEAYIEACTDPGQAVYEPFCGSGSTLIACEKTGRRCFGMEIDPRYCDVIVQRWENFTGQSASLSAG